MRRTFTRVTLVLACTVGCASGGSTSLTSSWRTQDSPPRELHRVLASFVSTDLAMRRSVEDRLAAQIPGSFPAYSAIPNLSLGNPEATREQLRRRLFDGAVVVRVMGLRADTTALPGSAGFKAYPGFYRYWQSSWTALRDPAHIAPDAEVQVEIVVYSLADDRLLWAGRTTTTNPGSVQELLDHSVDVAVRELSSKRVLR
jgi:hypothetical protein